MATLDPGRTVVLSVTQARKQWFQLLGMIDETGLVVLLTHHRQLKFALLPFNAANGHGIAITKHGRPVAALVSLREDTSLWRAMRDW
jgi:hypothetical protein